MPASRQCTRPRPGRSRAVVPRLARALALACLPGIAPAQQALPPIDAANVASWADATFQPALARGEFSGAVVSVVSGGEVVLSRGYGRADFSASAPVDPATTLFRIGSITKTFTATLLAQLIEEGRIGSLDDAANRYLRDYRLPDNAGVEITLHHLVTHTAGFEDRFYAIGADRPVAARLPPAQFEALRPGYVRPAGVRVVYSNFGIALLGRLIEDVTGQPIEAVMRERLLQPIGMGHSRLLVDVAEPAGLGRPATIHPDGSLHPTPYTAINPAIAAAGALVSTGDDMARYMLAQLGRSSPQFLSPTVLANLHDRRAGNAPESTGVGMTFFDEKWGEWRTISHGGNWEGFHSWMTLMPGRDAGIFVSVMSEAPPARPLRAVRDLFAPDSAGPRSPAVVSGLPYVQKFLGHFLGERRALPAPPAAFAAPAVEGWYLPDRRVFSTTEAVADLVYLGAAALRIDAKEHALELGGAGPWLAAGDGIFVLDAPTRSRVIIRDDPRVAAPVLIPDLGIYTSTRVAGYANPRLHAKLFAMALLLAGVAWLVLLSSSRGIRRSVRFAAATTTLLAWALPVVAMARLFDGRSMLETLYAGHVAPLAAFVVLAHLLGIAALATLLLAMRRPATPRLARACCLVIAAGGIAIVGLLAAYNVLGWQLPA